MEMERIADRALAAKRNAVLAALPGKPTGLLPRALPARTARPVAAKAEPVKRTAVAAAPAKSPVTAPALSPSFARMAACMRFRGYIAS